MSAALMQDPAHELLIALSGDAQQRHIGLLVRDESGAHHLLHLAWHWSLRWELHTAASLCARGYRCLTTGLSAPQQLRIAEHCIALGERINQRDPDFKQVGYGITAAGEGIDPLTMSWRSGPLGPGRTCASYLLELLESQGISILIRSSWPLDRAEDIAWQARIIETLRAWLHGSGIDGGADYIAFEAQHIGQVVRFRPEEVAASAAAPQDERPLCFNCAATRAATLLTRMVERDG
jgi:hypothetical protein